MAVTSTDQKQDQLNIMVPITTDNKTKIASHGDSEENMDMTCEQKDQLKMVVTSTTGAKEKISNGHSKEEDIGNNCDQQDKLKMAVKPTTNKKRKISKDNKKEEKAGTTSEQLDNVNMTVTPTDQKGISKGDKKEEKIGTTCHQCRQKIKGLSAHCTNKKKDKPCPSKFCHKCLMNRYGEQAEEKSILKDWNCPKCRGICNCSVCMKRRGHEPTGILVHTAKANGFSSVSELLRDQGPKALDLNKRPDGADEGTQNNNTLDLNNEPADDLQSERDNFVGIDLNSPPSSSIPTEKKKKRKRKELNDVEEISLPQGTEMTSVAGMDLPQEDVGHALQFLEFCTAFKEIFDLKEREPEYILVELIRGGNGCRGKQSPVIRFHIVLLIMIMKDLGKKSPVLTYKSGKGSWLQALQDCLTKSQDLLTKLKLEDVNLEVDEYESLSSSTRLRILNFLCDEVLCSLKLRTWIDEHNAKFTENVKVSKEQIQAAKQKESQLKLKMQDEVAKATIATNGDHLSTFEHEAIVSEIKSEIDQAHAEVLEAKKMVADEEQNCDSARVEPLISDINGRTYWRLKGYADHSYIFLQDVGSWDGFTCSERWFTVDAEQAKEVGERVSSLRERKTKPQRLKFTYVTKPDVIL